MFHGAYYFIGAVNLKNWPVFPSMMTSVIMKPKKMSEKKKSRLNSTVKIFTSL